jgi:phospholipid/cholesterol/gamma-HCH transport system substrate-binding protein
MLIASLAVLGAVSGCQWRGVNSLPLPGTVGRDAGSYLVQAEFPDVGNIQRNSRVRTGDVTVGSVTAIERRGWNALLTMRLGKDVILPANATATIGQTSLLGSLHVELAAPKDAPAEGRLQDGSLIPLSSAGAYPTTEQTLAAVSALLNGGGIGQIQDITEAFSAAFNSREGDLRSLIDQVGIFMGDLDEQTAEIIATAQSLQDLSSQIATKKPVLDNALRTLPGALEVLKNNRQQLTDALVKVGQLSALAESSVDQTKESIVAELKALGPVFRSLADAGPAMTRGLSALATYPWPTENIKNVYRGDYANLTGVFDLTLSRLDAGLLTGTRFEGNLTELEMQWGRTIGQIPSPYTGGNPMIVPYRTDQGR